MVTTTTQYCIAWPLQKASRKDLKVGKEILKLSLCVHRVSKRISGSLEGMYEINKVTGCNVNVFKLLICTNSKYFKMLFLITVYKVLKSNI